MTGDGSKYELPSLANFHVILAAKVLPVTNAPAAEPAATLALTQKPAPTSWSGFDSRSYPSAAVVVVVAAAVPTVAVLLLLLLLRSI